MWSDEVVKNVRSNVQTRKVRKESALERARTRTHTHTHTHIFQLTSPVEEVLIKREAYGKIF